MSLWTVWPCFSTKSTTCPTSPAYSSALCPTRSRLQKPQQQKQLGWLSKLTVVCCSTRNTFLWARTSCACRGNSGGLTRGRSSFLPASNKASAKQNFCTNSANPPPPLASTQQWWLYRASKRGRLRSRISLNFCWRWSESHPNSTFQTYPATTSSVRPSRSGTLSSPKRTQPHFCQGKSGSTIASNLLGG